MKDFLLGLSMVWGIPMAGFLSAAGTIWVTHWLFFYFYFGPDD